MFNAMDIKERAKMRINGLLKDRFVPALNIVTRKVEDIRKRIKIELSDFLKKDIVVGLDIGSSSVKIAQFTAKEGKLRFVRADLKEIGFSESAGGVRRETIEALKYLFGDISAQESKVILSVNCPRTGIKKIVVPYMPKAELNEAIRLEAKNYFPFSTDDSLIDCEVLSDFSDGGVRKLAVVVAVSPKTTIDRFTALMKDGGLSLSSCVPASYALYSLSMSLNSRADETRCLVDIGSEQSELIIVKDDELMFSRKIPVSGKDLTQALTCALVSERGEVQLSVEEAEIIKRRVGIPSKDYVGVVEGKISSAQIMALLRVPLEQLSGQIQGCFRYYQEEASGAKIDTVLLYGAGASLIGLPEFLSEDTGIEVKIGHCPDRLKLDRTLAHRLNLAVGCVEGSIIGVNLLPAEVKEKKKRFYMRGVFEVLATSVVVALILSYVGVNIQAGVFERKLKAANKELISLEPFFKEAQKISHAQRLLENEPYWKDIFIELGALVPEYIHITRLSMRQNTIFMEAILSSANNREGFIADFVQDLEKGLFNEVKLVSTKDLADNSGVEFELQCWVDYQ